MKVKRFIKNATVLILIMVSVLLIIDFTFRMLPQHNEIIQYDDYYLHTLIPNSEKVHIMTKEDGGGKNNIRINSFGFRGEEFKKVKESKRIIVYGDSFIEAEFSKLENTFPKQLEKKAQPKAGGAGGGYQWRCYCLWARPNKFKAGK